ncbi:hypothetical protein FHN55_10180 [Streptomyces sp. NP160]|uniref:hypothetical protein n=1 Tax=Streptomyces sp. NP160 TaxID=2586637 RepID=UPI00111B2996|nr:hypothetical protein [Streptomyces sp. NP160]TNM67418.1 hypothetical protein FHN55_10180 [Streptomyces sp. NP160]
MDHLVYISFGEGRHVDEVRFSVQTAARHLGAPRGDWRIDVWTDSPQAWKDLPVEVVEVAPEQVDTWMGPHRYVWRSKIEVLRAALERSGGGRCLYVDGDTWWRRSPTVVFDRIGPGRSVMHLREGRPPAPEVAALDHVLQRYQPVDTSGRPWVFPADRDSWNAGVIGLDPADAAVCADVALLTDQLLEHGFGDHSHTSEQLAFAVGLAARTSVAEARDAVVHYWPTEMRAPFSAALAGARSADGVPAGELFDRLWAQRPRVTAERAAKDAAKRLLRRVGVRR